MSKSTPTKHFVVCGVQGSFGSWRLACSLFDFSVFIIPIVVHFLLEIRQCAVPAAVLEQTFSKLRLRCKFRLLLSIVFKFYFVLFTLAKDLRRESKQIE